MDVISLVLEVSNSSATDLSETAEWFSIIAGTTGAAILIITLIKPGINILKHFMSPKMSANFAFPYDDENWPESIINRTDDRLVVRPEETIEFEVSVKTNHFQYCPTIVEFITRDGSSIDESRLFIEERRWWEKPYPGPDHYGNFKIQTPGLVIKPGGITGEGTHFGFKLSPLLESFETRILTFRLEVEESRHLFVKEFTIQSASALETKRWASHLGEWINENPNEAEEWHTASELVDIFDGMEFNNEPPLTDSRKLGQILVQNEEELERLYDLVIDRSNDKVNRYRFNNEHKPPVPHYED